VGRFKLNVVAPCSESWKGMAGDARARFCTKCDRTVHDLSAMNDANARALLADPAERVCVRFAVRRDGTVVTGGRGRWLGSALGALAIAVVAVVFWTSVTLLQRPWRALARTLAASTSPVPQPFQPSADDEERRRAYDELMKRLAESRQAMMAAYSAQFQMMGTPRAQGDFLSLGLELARLADRPKHAKKSRR
jgi:hypothetical protein